MTTVDLNQFVEQLPQKLGHRELAQAWTELANTLRLDPNDGMYLVVSSARDLSLKHAGRTEPAFGGAWQWNLSEGVAKAVVVGILVAGVLAAAGASAGMAPVIIPTVIPFLFDVKRIRLERTEDQHLRIIGARPATQRVGAPDELYDTLPEEIRSSVSKAQFTDFLFKAAEAGRAVNYGSFFEVLPNGETAFKLTVT
ncbi:MAG: hypothetical protein U1G07_25545 [Verrucomicrobiota bacterium]